MHSNTCMCMHEIPQQWCSAMMIGEIRMPHLMEGKIWMPPLMKAKIWMPPLMKAKICNKETFENLCLKKNQLSPCSLKKISQGVNNWQPVGHQHN